jgi:quercetin dioxygenase-like cupin family protein
MSIVASTTVHLRMTKCNLLLEAEQVPQTWRSIVIGQAAGANLKVLRMDDSPYPDETHDFDEALLVLDGQMNLEIHNELITVKQGEVFIVPAGVPHAVAPGSTGTLVIIDR